MNINIALEEEDLALLMKGEAVSLALTPARLTEPVNVNIILQDIGFGRMYQQLKAAMMQATQQATAASLAAAEGGTEDQIVLDRLAHVDEESPILLRVSPEAMASLTLFMHQIVEKMPPDRDDVDGRVHMALYAFQLGHDYAMQFGSVT